MTIEPVIPENPPHRLARIVLLSFIVTFVMSRAVVLLIMSKCIPNMFLFLQGTHVHHLNYGIFLLTAVSGYLLFCRPDGKAARRTAMAYGFAIGLTFDEFGMWLHLGGSYWQRTSVDAVIVVAAALALVGFAQSIRTYEAKHFRAFVVLVLTLLIFGWVIFSAGNRLGAMMGPPLRELELSSSP